MAHKQHRQVNIPAVPHKKEGAYCAFPQCEWKYGEYLAVVVRHCAPSVVTISCCYFTFKNHPRDDYKDANRCVDLLLPLEYVYSLKKCLLKNNKYTVFKLFKLSFCKWLKKVHKHTHFTMCFYNLYKNIYIIKCIYVAVLSPYRCH